MKQHEYTKSLTVLGYATRELFEIEKTRIDNLDFNIEEILPDHIVYALSRSFGSMFHAIFKMTEQVAGQDVALEVAKRAGIRLGKANYGAFLKARGVGRGTPALFCEYQDKIHSIRGPLHASSRFGQFDDEKCIVRRRRCIYYEFRLEGTEQYIGALESGMCEGYSEIDPAIVKTENPRCLWKGDDGCEHIWWFKP